MVGCEHVTLADRQDCESLDLWYVSYWPTSRSQLMSARFNLLSSVVIGVTALICLYAPGVDASMAGFALAFANTSSHDLLFVVRRFVQLEQSMVALERIKEYSEIEKEPAEFVEPRPAASWPHAGTISVEKLVIRYAVSAILTGGTERLRGTELSLNFQMSCTRYHSMSPLARKSGSLDRQDAGNLLWR
jgi:ABC-type multidrug transport system fused ATPase/permease subunit